MLKLEYKTFLDNVLAELTSLGISTAQLQIDHLAYKTATQDSFEKLLVEFAELGEKVHDAPVGEYRVAVFKLREPFIYNGQEIGAIELLTAPKYAGTPDDWDHAEFLLASGYESLLTSYPELKWNTDAINRAEFPMITLTLPSGLRVKFPKDGVLEAVRLLSVN